MEINWRAAPNNIISLHQEKWWPTFFIYRWKHWLVYRSYSFDFIQIIKKFNNVQLSGQQIPPLKLRMESIWFPCRFYFFQFNNRFSLNFENKYLNLSMYTYMYSYIFHLVQSTCGFSTELHLHLHHDSAYKSFLRVQKESRKSNVNKYFHPENSISTNFTLVPRQIFLSQQKMNTLQTWPLFIFERGKASVRLTKQNPAFMYEEKQWVKLLLKETGFTETDDVCLHTAAEEHWGGTGGCWQSYIWAHLASLWAFRDNVIILVLCCKLEMSLWPVRHNL